MTTSDSLPFVAFISFGVWWLAFPQSVIRFYAWFHKGKIKLPQPAAVRAIGAGWIVLIAVISFAAQKK